MTLKNLLIACLSSTLFLVGCGDNSSAPSNAPSSASPPGNGNNPAPATNAVIQGRVIDAQDGAPVAGAKLTIGTAVTTSGADGSYAVNVVADARMPLVAEADNYAESVKIASASAGATSTFDIKLLKVGATAQLAQATGGVVTVPGSAAQVTLPANFAAKADGSAPTGPVTVKLTPIRPAEDSSFMPGDYTTMTGTGPVPIESFGALTVNLTDSTGSALNLAPGKTATVRIALSTRSGNVPPATIPLFYVSKDTGRWVEEGSATLQGTAPNQYYEGVVSHFSTWNADQVMNSVAVTGCVVDESGLAAAGVAVRSDGIDYSGTSSAVTNASGTFQISIKRDGRATLGGFIGNKFSNEVTAGPSAADFSIGQCLTLATAANSIKIKLTWGQSPSDLDSYITLPSGEVIYFGNDGSLVTAPFVNLDVDDTSSFGPEVITIRRLMVGTYQYAVRNYNGTHNPGITASPAKVELTLGTGATSIYAPPAGEPGAGNTVWSVFNLTIAANCSVTVTPVNTWSLTQPASTTIVEPTYCVAP